MMTTTINDSRSALSLLYDMIRSINVLISILYIDDNIDDNDNLDDCGCTDDDDDCGCSDGNCDGDDVFNDDNLVRLKANDLVNVDITWWTEDIVVSSNWSNNTTSKNDGNIDCSVIVLNNGSDIIMIIIIIIIIK